MVHARPLNCSSYMCGLQNHSWPSCGIARHTDERSNKLQRPSMCTAVHHAPISTAKPNPAFKK